MELHGAPSVKWSGTKKREEKKGKGSGGGQRGPKEQREEKEHYIGIEMCKHLHMSMCICV